MKRRYGLTLAVPLAALLATGVAPRIAARRTLDAAPGAAAAVTTVAVVAARRADTTTRLLLPGTIQGRQQTPIYARTGGYVVRWTADIGARVRDGQLLAEIASPELDEELGQARAQLAETRTGLNLARTTLDRYLAMAADSVITRQELDERQAASDAAVGAVEREDANVRRLLELQRFRSVRAPFPGVITARNVSLGSLITVGGGSAAVDGAASPLFEIAQSDTVRVGVNVPQTYAPGVAPGQRAELVLREFPSRPWAGRVARTAGALDPASRTLRVEVEVPNPDGALLPGMYAQVRFVAKRTDPPLEIPATALLLGPDGPRVAVVDSAGRVHRVPVEVGRDLGPTVELLSGVPEGSSLVLDAPESLAENALVRPAERASP